MKAEIRSSMVGCHEEADQKREKLQKTQQRAVKLAAEVHKATVAELGSQTVENFSSLKNEVTEILLERPTECSYAVPQRCLVDLGEMIRFCSLK